MGATTRKTIEYAKEAYLNKGLILEDKEYINKRTKMNCHDLEGYKYKLSLDCVLDKRTKKFEPIGKFNPYFAENLDNFIKINNATCELLSRNYTKSGDKITIKCECGEKYLISVCHFLGEKKFTCNKCSFKKSNCEKLKNSEIVTFKTLKELGYELIDFENKHNIVVKDKDGYIFNTSIFNIMNEKFTFDKFQRFNKFNKFTIHNMLNYIKLNEIKIEMVNKNPRQIEVKKDYIEWYCIDCGEIFMATWGQVVYDRNNKSTQRLRCEKCSKRQSNLEYTVEQYLIEKGIEYIKEYRFEDCKNKHTLPFDFYLQKYNTVCEVNGEQHYYENTMFEQSLKERQRIDKIKKDYCINNGINFVEIPVWKIVNKHKTKGYKILIDNILNQD